MDLTRINGELAQSYANKVQIANVPFSSKLFGLVPSGNFADIITLSQNIGPILCIDMNNSVYAWTTSAYFTGYRNVNCGIWLDGTSDSAPNAWELSAIGGTWLESDPKQLRVITKYEELGLTVASGSWTAGPNVIANTSTGVWKAPDLRNMFKRTSGTDADTANAAPSGTYKPDTVGPHAHLQATQTNAAATGSGVVVVYASSVWSSTPSGGGVYQGKAETAPKHTRVSPVILV